MNKYNAYFKGKQIEVTAATSYAAQQAAAALFKARKAYQVTVVLVQRADGSEVLHSTASF